MSVCSAIAVMLSFPFKHEVLLGLFEEFAFTLKVDPRIDSLGTVPLKFSIFHVCINIRRIYEMTEGKLS